MKGLPYNTNISVACQKMLSSSEVSESEVSTINSIVEFGNDHKFVTAKQSKLLGTLYKKIVNGGEYIQHDWWKDDILVEYYINQHNWPTELEEAKEFAISCISLWKYQAKAEKSINSVNRMTAIGKIQQLIVHSLLSGEGLKVK